MSRATKAASRRCTGLQPPLDRPPPHTVESCDPLPVLIHFYAAKTLYRFCLPEEEEEQFDKAAAEGKQCEHAQL